jgi:hypothetical protein
MNENLNVITQTACHDYSTDLWAIRQSIIMSHARSVQWPAGVRPVRVTAESGMRSSWKECLMTPHPTFSGRSWPTM